MDAREEIVKLVNNNLANVARECKEHTVFQVILKMGQTVIKVVFWRLNNYTLVAHNYKVPVEPDGEIFLITAYHDSCWRYDGFSFLNKFSREQIINLEIVSSEILEHQNCFIDDEDEYFVILNS